MLKIAFVSPPLGLAQRYGRLAPLGSSMPSIALLSLAAVAKKEGFEVLIIPADSMGLDRERITERISQFQPDCLAITSTTPAIYEAHRLAERVKRLNNKITTLIGGHHISALPRETMRHFPGFDIGIVNEGELTLSELLGRLDRKEPIEPVKGIVFRGDGEIVLNDTREFIVDLDTLPYPAWELLEGFPSSYYPPFFRFKRMPAAAIVTSRGCPQQCIFCSKAVFGNHIRFFGAEYVFGMMELLRNRYGVKEILIEDDTFLVKKERARDICALILKNRLDISWSCLARVDDAEEDILRLMKRSGCWQIGFGIESGSQEVLDLAKKNINLADARRAMEIARKTGISTKGFFILGFPNDTPATLEDTAGFIRESSLSDISVSFMTPMPGTELYSRAGELGRFDDNWEKMSLLNIVFIPKGLSREQLKKYSRLLVRRFYLRPKVIFAYILRVILNPFACVRAVRGLWGFLRECR
ncbi:MAG: radical SAM protein [Candidatus Omnitrophota bacterium]|jgi:radical SAM superfamily enzyme YgiQ (UPF0313 family)